MLRELDRVIETDHPGLLPEENEYPGLGVTIPASAVQVGGNHYKDVAIQPAEFITKNGIGFLEGCVIKRMVRHKNKNGKEDLRKAIHEIELLIEYEYGE